MGSARGKVAKWRYPILGHKTAILATFFEIWTSNLFCPPFTLTLIYKPSLKSIRPKLAILSQKNSKNSPKVVFGAQFCFRIRFLGPIFAPRPHMGNVVPMDSKLLSNYWYMSWPSWPTHISKLCSHKNQGWTPPPPLSGGEGSQYTLVKFLNLNLDIAVDQQTRACDQTFERAQTTTGRR